MWLGVTSSFSSLCYQLSAAVEHNYSKDRNTLLRLTLCLAPKSGTHLAWLKLSVASLLLRRGSFILASSV